MTASAIRIPIASPEEPLLDLVIDEGNNPPSEIRSITAVFAELPWIYFESTADTVIARYGNPSLKAPRYDLEAVRQTLSIANMMDAAWGEARLRTAAESVSSVVPTLPTVGSTLDPATFRYVRPLPSGEPGLVTIPLDAAVLAHSQGVVFSDVRVLDASNRQVPYLVERASEPLSLDLTIEPVTTRPASLPQDRTRQRVSRAPTARAVFLPRVSSSRRQHACSHGG